MADHYAVPTNAVLDLLRPKWMKGTALPKVAAILLFVLGISAAGCSQADLTEPGDSPVPMMTPSETFQPSMAISISKPTPTPPETAQPLAPRTLWRISGPENLMASTPSANLHIHDVVLPPQAHHSCVLNRPAKRRLRWFGRGITSYFNNPPCPAY